MRTRKAVSPVIAVVLLIALTAAAVGVVWVLFNNLATPTQSVVITDIDNATLDTSPQAFNGTVIFTSTGVGTLKSISIGSYTITTTEFSSTTVNDGSNQITFGAVYTGSYTAGSSVTVRITVTIDGTEYISAPFEVAFN